MQKKLFKTRGLMAFLMVFSLVVQIFVPAYSFAEEQVIYTVAGYKAESKEGQKVKVKGYIKGSWDGKESNLELDDTLDSENKSGIPVQYSKKNRVIYDEIIKANPDKKFIISGTRQTYFKNEFGLKDITNIKLAPDESVTPPPDDSTEPVPSPDEPKPETPEPNVEITPISNVIKANNGEKFTVRGFVISRIGSFGGKNFYLQDESGDAIYVYTKEDRLLNLGDEVVLTATLGEYGNSKQLINLEKFEKTSKQIEVPEAKLVEVENLANEKQATLIKLEELTITNVKSGKNTTLTVEKGGKSTDIYIFGTTNIDVSKYTKGKIIDVIGILSTFKQKFQILPFENSHIVLKGEEDSEEESENYLKIGDIQGESHVSPYEGKEVKVKDVIVTSVHNSGMFYVQDIEPDNNENTSNGIAVKHNGHNLQEGSKLTISGVVEEYYGDGYRDKKSTDLTITRINATSVVQNGTADIPQKTIINTDTIPKDVIDNDGMSVFDPKEDALDFWESVEGMIVGIESGTIIGPRVHGDIYILPGNQTERLNKMGGINLNEKSNPDLISFSIYKDSNANYGGIVVKSGDKIDEFSGPVTYSFGGYRIYIPKDKVDEFKTKIVAGSTEPEKSTIEFEEDKITIASYNVENFAPESGETSMEKVNRIANSIVNQLSQPDIIAIVEMQDDSGSDKNGVVTAEKNAKILIDAIKEHGGKQYTYAEIPPIDNQDGGKEGANIRVAFLYISDRVSLEKLELIGRDRFEFESVRKSLAGSFKFKDNELLVIVNHFNSKRGDHGLFGKHQPPVFSSVEKRVKLARIINDYVVSKKLEKPGLNVVVTGDFNDFEYTDTLRILEGDILTNLVKNHDESDRFSYYYRGNSQTLDHMLVSNKLVEDSKFDMVHINSMFMEEHDRASDHDPVIVQLKLDSKVEDVEPGTPDEDGLELISIKNLINSEIGKLYKTKGTVISKVGVLGKKAFYIQDEEHGIYIYTDNDIKAKLGDEIILKGKLGNYKGNLQLTDVEFSDKKEAEIITPKELKINELQNSNQSTLVKISNVKVRDFIRVNEFGTSEFLIYDEDNNFAKVRYDNRSGEKYDQLKTRLKNGDIVDVTGILSSYNGEIQILPYSKSGINVVESIIDIPDESYYSIGQIQGVSHNSPFEGKTVKVKDVVVTFVENENEFYVQDINPDNDPRTSDGISVYKPGHSLIEGDRIEIEGSVLEFLGRGYSDNFKTDLTITKITADKVEKKGKENLPEHLVINGSSIPSEIIENDGFTQFDPQEDSIDFWESIEGMIVKIDSGTIIGPQLYGDIYLLPSDTSETLNKLGGYNLKENHNPNIISVMTKDNSLKIKAGDKLVQTIHGPVTYSFGGYKIYVPSKDIKDKIEEGNTLPEKSTISFEHEKLTIASYNVENFSALSVGKGSTSDEKVNRIAKSIVSDLNKPDIVALIEMQDDDGPKNTGEVSAKKSAERLTDAILSQENGIRYEYIDINPEDNMDGGAPGANIRVGFIYNPERVSLMDIEAIGKGISEFDGVRKSLAARFTFKGEEVLVIANHLNSKRGDDSLFGKIQPVKFPSAEKRAKLAQVIRNYVSDKLVSNPQLNVVLTGDFNDFEFTDTLKILEGDTLTNLVKNHESEDRFSYFYRGNSQTLDHMLVSNKLVEKAKFDMVHINSMFTEFHGRASDHDPVIVQLEFENKDQQEDDEETYSQHTESINSDLEEISQLLANEIGDLSKYNMEAYDIRFRNAKGEFKSKFENKVKVEVNLENSGGKEVEGLKIYHINEDGSFDKIEEFDLDGNKVIFEFDSFSAFVFIYKKTGVEDDKQGDDQGDKQDDKQGDEQNPQKNDKSDKTDKTDKKDQGDNKNNIKDKTTDKTKTDKKENITPKTGDLGIKSYLVFIVLSIIVLIVSFRKQRIK